MLRTTVKIFAYVVICIDILYCLTIDPRMALTRAVFVAAAAWAWKLY